METPVEKGQKVEEHFLFVLQELDEMLYEKYCQGEISPQDFQKTCGELRLWSHQAEKLLKSAFGGAETEHDTKTHETAGLETDSRFDS